MSTAVVVEPPTLCLFRLYTLRLAYSILAVGLAFYAWPLVIEHGDDVAASAGIRLSLLAGLGAAAALGLRYPAQMLPLLLFELLWKAVYLAAFALPLWSAHRMPPSVAADTQSVLVVVILVPLIPWRYVLRQYVLKRGDRWK